MFDVGTSPSYIPSFIRDTCCWWCFISNAHRNLYQPPKQDPLSINLEEGFEKKRNVIHNTIVLYTFRMLTSVVKVYQAWNDRLYNMHMRLNTLLFDLMILNLLQIIITIHQISLSLTRRKWSFRALFTLSKIHRVNDNKVCFLGENDGTYCNTHIGAA